LTFAIEDQNEYKSGRVICQENISKIKNEIPYWIQVPKYYDPTEDPKQTGTTEIYAYTLHPINYSKPTLLFFVGGPGMSSRTLQFDLPNVNIIYFEQRGISCSRPLIKDDFFNPKFYSSKNTAKDALAIIKALNISEVTIYGHSYGTIPATIFASLFPEYTKNLVLESVINTADETLIHSKLKKTNLQNLFDSYDIKMQNKIINIGETLAPANWFSKAGTMMLYLNDGIITYKRFLDKLLETPDDNIKKAIEYFYYTNSDEDPLYSSQVTLGMLSCQETLVAKRNLNSLLIFNKQRKLKFEKASSFFNSYCRQLNIEIPRDHFYKAKYYPVNSPVYYFLGESDGATDKDQGVDHFNTVPQGKRHLLIMKNGGHLSNLGFIKDSRPCDPDSSWDHCESQILNQLQVDIFNSIIQFNALDYKQINDFNQLSQNPWFVVSSSFQMSN